MPTGTPRIWPVLFNPAIEFAVANTPQPTSTTLLLAKAGYTACEAIPLKAIRHPHTWSITLPLGLLQGDLAPKAGLAGSALFNFKLKEQEAEEKLFTKIKASYLRAGMLHQVRIINHERFYSVALIRAMAYAPDEPIPLLDALRLFLERANKGEVVIATPDELRLKPLQSSKRGRNWSREEDAVLHEWFTMRPDGTRHRLGTEEAWAAFLSTKLGGKYTQRQVAVRISYLNLLLKRALEDRDHKLDLAARKRFFETRLGQLRIHAK